MMRRGKEVDKEFDEEKKLMRRGKEVDEGDEDYNPETS